MVKLAAMWMPVVGYEGLYEVSDEGQIRRVGTNATIAQRGSRKGYLRVNLCKNGKKTTISVHRIVLDAFVGLKPKGWQCCHFDGDKTNNHLSNLRWDTPLNNHLDSVRLGKIQPKLNERAVRQIRAKRENGATYKELARQFGIGKERVVEVCKYKAWAYVADAEFEN